jgi:hypothetical protein
MSKEFSYKSDEYDRQAQRFILPLYIKDDLENYNYSSTATLVQYNGRNYIIFAAHALNNDIYIDNVYTPYNDGSYRLVKELSIGYEMFEENDIVIIDHFNNKYDGKNYFNLNLTSLIGFYEEYFAWTGFPYSKVKAKIIHKTKSAETSKQEYFHVDKDKIYSTALKYFTIESSLISIDDDYIKGNYNTKKKTLKYAGDVEKTPHPKGMSGGAMYFFTKTKKLEKELDNTFRFAGIGIEYDEKNNQILGVSNNKIIELLDIFNKDNPLSLHFDSSYIKL